MPKKVAIIISPNWRDYAKKYLAECFESISRQDYAGEMKIFITDNESTEESYGYLKNVFKSKIPLAPFNKGGKFEIVRNKNNDGFAKGNNDAIKLALGQDFPYIILFNMDTVLEKDCVTQMIKAIDDEKIFLNSRLGGNDKKDMDTVLDKDCVKNMVETAEMDSCFRRNDERKVGAVQARIMLYDDKEKINSLGNVTHFLGFGYSRGYGKKYNSPTPFRQLANQRGISGKSPLPPLLKGAEICYPSGAAVLFKAEVLKKIGLFDERFWMYNEDQDLGWRVWLAGFSCVLAPEAAVYHKYQFNRSIKKYYFMDRNRIIAMLKNYHWLTLVLIAPAFLIMEIGLIFFAIRGGWLKEKIQIYKYFLSLKNWRYLRQARRQTQALRRVKDKEIIKLFSGKIWYQEIGDIRLRVANVIFNVYWNIIKILIIW